MPVLAKQELRSAKSTQEKAGTKKGEKGPSALKNSGFQVIVPIFILNEGYVMVHGSSG